MKVRTHLFRGRRYRIVTARLRKKWGECDPSVPGSTLYFDPNIMAGDTLGDLDILIHESLHACLGDLDEESVTETAKCVAKFLWRLGWRKEA